MQEVPKIDKVVQLPTKLSLKRIMELEKIKTGAEIFV